MPAPAVFGKHGDIDPVFVGEKLPGHMTQLAPADHTRAILGDEPLLEILRRVPALVPVPPLFEALGVIGVRRPIYRDHGAVIGGRESTQRGLRRGSHGPGQSARAEARANVKWVTLPRPLRAPASSDPPRASRGPFRSLGDGTE